MAPQKLGTPGTSAMVKVKGAACLLATCFAVGDASSAGVYKVTYTTAPTHEHSLATDVRLKIVGTLGESQSIDLGSTFTPLSDTTVEIAVGEDIGTVEGITLKGDSAFASSALKFVTVQSPNGHKSQYLSDVDASDERTVYSYSNYSSLFTSTSTSQLGHILLDITTKKEGWRRARAGNTLPLVH